jgi:phosphate transport system protein
MVTGHTAKAFDCDLEVLSQMLAEMGRLAERQVAETITALTTCDKESAHQLVATDAAIDSIQRMIDKGVVEMIARRQPVAGDLRQVLSILRIAHELERIGDLAKNIGKRILALGAEDLTRSSMLGVRQMAAVMLARLRQVLDSVGRRDQEMAFGVWVSDEDVDHVAFPRTHHLHGKRPKRCDVRYSSAFLHQEPGAHGRSRDEYCRVCVLHG